MIRILLNLAWILAWATFVVLTPVPPWTMLVVGFFCLMGIIEALDSLTASPHRYTGGVDPDNLTQADLVDLEKWRSEHELLHSPYDVS